MQLLIHHQSFSPRVIAEPSFLPALLFIFSPSLVFQALPDAMHPGLILTHLALQAGHTLTPAVRRQVRAVETVSKGDVGVTDDVIVQRGARNSSRREARQLRTQARREGDESEGGMGRGRGATC